jgi:hypothetical protein
MVEEGHWLDSGIHRQLEAKTGVGIHWQRCRLDSGIHLGVGCIAKYAKKKTRFIFLLPAAV